MTQMRSNTKIGKNYNPVDEQQLRIEKPFYSEDAEKSVLSAMMLDRKAVPIALNILQEEHFFFDKHQKLFKIMGEMFTSSTPIDLVTLCEEVEKQGLNHIISTYDISIINSLLPSSANIEHHSRILLDLFLKRELKDVLLNNASNDVIRITDSIDHLDALQSKLIDLQEHFVIQDKKDPVKAAERFQDIIQNPKKRKSLIIPTGFSGFDSITNGGLRSGELWIFAARPSIGKTSLALSMQAYMSYLHNVPTAMLSLEMTEYEMFNKLASITTYIPFKKIRNVDLDESEKGLLSKFISLHAKKNLIIDDSARCNEITMFSKAKMYVQQFGIKVLFIDYLQKMNTAKKSENRNRELGTITGIAKEIAKELNIAVVMLSQLNRDTLKNNRNKPNIGQLRDSGEIEADADGVVLIHRPEKDGFKDFADGQTSSGRARLLIEKQRNGEVNVSEQVIFWGSMGGRMLSEDDNIIECLINDLKTKTETPEIKEVIENDEYHF